MKNHFLCVLFCTAVVLCCSCAKDKNCACTVNSIDQYATITDKTVIMNVDGDMDCEDITVVGDEWMARDGYTSSKNTVSCVEQ